MTNSHDDGKLIPIKKRAREFVVQAMYYYLISGRTLTQNDLIFKMETNMELFGKKNPERAQAEKTYFEYVVTGMMKNITDLDAQIQKTFKGVFSEIAIVEQAIVMVSVYELSILKTPKRFVIAEALRLSDLFTDERFYKKLNAYLDTFE